MKEGVRTIILFALLIVAIGFIMWSQNSYNQNFLDTL